MKSRWLQYIEVATALSVIITLVVLIVEVRTNTKTIERQLLVDRAGNIARPFMSSPELLEAFERIKEVDGWNPGIANLREYYGLEPQQAIAWNMFLLANWSGLEADFVTVGPSDGLRSQIRGLMRFPDNHIFWSNSSGAFRPSFVAYVDQVRNEGDSIAR